MTYKEEKKTERLINHPIIQLSHEDVLVSGWKDVDDFLRQTILSKINKKNPVCIVGIDGYPGTDWLTIISHLKVLSTDKNVDTIFINVENSQLSKEETDKLLQPYLGSDPIFGKIYKKELNTLYDSEKIQELKTKLVKLKKRCETAQPLIVICYGTGTLLKKLRSEYDIKIYFDLSRETTLKRNKDWGESSGKTQSIGPKKLYYVDMQVNDSHRNRLLESLDYYVDGNDTESPVLTATSTFLKITNSLANSPLRLKYFYEPGPWGGQWLKKIRELPTSWVNCAWSFEVIATEMSLLAKIGEETLEIPWTTLFYLQYDLIMGNIPRRRFNGEFPIRFDYLDTMDGGDLSIQVHPGTSYIQKNFGETYHQGEMYYVVDAKKGATVNLGLKEDADLQEFKQAALLAEEKGIKLDGNRFVNKIPGKKHDLLMIPPGTVHGAGEGLVVLEISSTTYRYTFKIYDYLRPDLNGSMRPIHIEHAFNVIKPFRRSKWVAKNLIQQPVLIRSGSGWEEYLIGDRKEFFHVVYRLEFDQAIEDDTSNNFHLLTLVEGDSVELYSVEDPNKSVEIDYSETVIIPACFGKYKLVNQGMKKAKVVKARLR